jgi:hypothetical protein
VANDASYTDLSVVFLKYKNQEKANRNGINMRELATLLYHKAGHVCLM